MEALENACRSNSVHGLILHSDRGSHFTCRLFRAALRRHEIRQSMSGTGCCYDNTRMESFFATLDFFTHKSVKNNGLETQYFIEGHHEPIIEKSDWLLVQQIRKEWRYTRRQTRKCKPQIVVKGPLAGFIIADPKWEPEDVDSIMES